LGIRRLVDAHQAAVGWNGRCSRHSASDRCHVRRTPERRQRILGLLESDRRPRRLRRRQRGDCGRLL